MKTLIVPLAGLAILLLGQPALAEEGLREESVPVIEMFLEEPEKESEDPAAASEQEEPKSPPNDGAVETTASKETLVTIGAVGDIMVMPGQIAYALDEETGTYDFSKSFQAMRPYLQGPDLMCGNLETTLAGPEAGYTESISKKGGKQRFSAPDALAQNLLDAGFDVLTTGNNHALDFGFEGVVRTRNVLEQYGFYTTGTYRTEEERTEPLIVEKNGLKIGIVAATQHHNGYIQDLPVAARKHTLALLEPEGGQYLSDIAACKEAGADFILAFAHWGKEKQNQITGSQRIYADALLEAGADVVLGSHPHRVQEMEYRTVERADGPHTGLVVYSMGNFLSNMFHIPEFFGLYVQLTVRGIPGEKASLEKVELLPLVTLAHPDGYWEIHEVIPALTDPQKIQSVMPFEPYDLGLIGASRKHITSLCLTEGVEMMEEP